MARAVERDRPNFEGASAADSGEHAASRRGGGVRDKWRLVRGRAALAKASRLRGLPCRAAPARAPHQGDIPAGSPGRSLAGIARRRKFVSAGRRNQRSRRACYPEPWIPHRPMLVFLRKRGTEIRGAYASRVWVLASRQDELPSRIATDLVHAIKTDAAGKSAQAGRPR